MLRTIWKVLATNEDAMQVALRAAVGDVAPVLILVNLPQPCKPVEHPHLADNCSTSAWLPQDRLESVTWVFSSLNLTVFI